MSLNLNRRMKFETDKGDVSIRLSDIFIIKDSERKGYSIITILSNQEKQDIEIKGYTQDLQTRVNHFIDLT